MSVVTSKKFKKALDLKNITDQACSHLDNQTRQKLLYMTFDKCSFGYLSSNKLFKTTLNCWILFQLKVFTCDTARYFIFWQPCPLTLNLVLQYFLYLTIFHWFFFKECIKKTPFKVYIGDLCHMMLVSF